MFIPYYDSFINFEWVTYLAFDSLSDSMKEMQSFYPFSY